MFQRGREEGIINRVECFKDAFFPDNKTSHGRYCKLTELPYYEVCVVLCCVVLCCVVLCCVVLCCVVLCCVVLCCVVLCCVVLCCAVLCCAVL
jgi:hypothetical protein